MFEGIRSPAIHTPHTIGEALSILARMPSALIWAGGTYIMSRPSYYGTQSPANIIDLSQIPDLSKITRNDRAVEIGAMVTADQLLSTGRLLLSDLLLETLKSISSPLCRRQFTIGGALCTPDIRLSIPTALSVMDASAEIRSLQGNRTTTKWVSVSRLYDKDGSLLLPPKTILTKVRISLDTPDFQRFRVIDEPMYAPRHSVQFAFHCQTSQGVLSKVRFCFAYPVAGIHQSREMEALLNSLALPLGPARIRKLSYQIIGEITKAHPAVTPLQMERSRRLFEAVFHDIDSLAMEK